MSLRTVALVSGVVGGLCWLALLVLDQAGSGRPGLHDALHWAGLVLLAVAMVGFGASLVSSSALWLRVIVGHRVPGARLVGPRGVPTRPVDPEVVDGIFGGGRRAPLDHRARPAPGATGPAPAAHARGAHAR